MDSDTDEVAPPSKPGVPAGSGEPKPAAEEADKPGMQGQEAAETAKASTLWKYAKAARAQEAHEGVQPLAAAARGRGYRALCRTNMDGVISGYHMISSWNQAFFVGIQREEGDQPAAAGAKGKSDSNEGPEDE